MPKSLVLGNGNILVCLDRYAQLRDFYFPYVGLENHLSSHCRGRMGLWAEGRLRWLTDPGWQVRVDSEPETFVGRTTAENQELALSLNLIDVVYNEKNIFLRKITVQNLADGERTIKIFFDQEFEIYGSHRGDTAYFDPGPNVIIHYKGRRVFLIGGRLDGENFSDWSTGVFQLEGREGTYRDAEDGQLAKNPIDYGQTDSILSFTIALRAKDKQTLYYWVAAGKTVSEAEELHQYVMEKTPEHLFQTTHDFWAAWIHKRPFNFYGLDSPVVELFKKSLFIIRAHADNHGAIIASGDSEMLQYGRDTYSYMWPRDAAFAAIALNKAGDFNVTRRFFEFCNQILTKDGYFLHKYRPDMALGSSWHPWIRDGEPALPIQEDATALVIWALSQYYQLTRDLEFVEKVYNSLIKKAADFLVDYRDPKNGLPRPSYNLWEEKYGTLAFTAAAVYGALVSAAQFARMLGKIMAENKYNTAAHDLGEAVVRNFYDRERGYFKSGLGDSTLDASSIFGVFKFGILPADDPKVVSSIKFLEEKLCCRTEIGGVPRYVGDRYYAVSDDLPGNPWLITTMWLAQYYIARAKKEEDLEETKKWLNWAARHAQPAGILSEQVNPYTGEQISAAPLAWSQAEFVITVIEYLEKLEALGICKTCYPIKV